VGSPPCNVVGSPLRQFSHYLKRDDPDAAVCQCCIVVGEFRANAEVGPQCLSDQASQFRQDLGSLIACVNPPAVARTFITDEIVGASHGAEMHCHRPRSQALFSTRSSIGKRGCRGGVTLPALDAVGTALRGRGVTEREIRVCLSVPNVGSPRPFRFIALASNHKAFRHRSMFVPYAVAALQGHCGVDLTRKSNQTKRISQLACSVTFDVRSSTDVQLVRSRDGSSAGSLIGSNGARSMLCAAPSAINSAIASPVAGELRIPQTLCPVAT
jgi:hypothetical protein